LQNFSFVLLPPFVFIRPLFRSLFVLLLLLLFSQFGKVFKGVRKADREVVAIKILTIGRTPSVIPNVL